SIRDSSFIFLLLTLRPPRSPLFPYTTLFRSSIAIVHETLSESFDEHVDFDDVADRVAEMVADVSTVATQVETRRTGSFGVLDSEDRKSTRLNSSHDQISYAVFCLKKKTWMPM